MHMHDIGSARCERRSERIASHCPKLDVRIFQSLRELPTAASDDDLLETHFGEAHSEQFGLAFTPPIGSRQVDVCNSHTFRHSDTGVSLQGRRLSRYLDCQFTRFRIQCPLLACG